MSNGDDKESDAEGPESERRRDLRHLACFPAHLHTGEGVARSALIRDLSVSGALLLTRARFKVGDRVKLTLYLNDGLEVYPIEGSVVREERRSVDLAHPWTKSVAVKFDRLLADLEPQIKALADHQARMLGRPSSSK